MLASYSLDGRSAQAREEYVCQLKDLQYTIPDKQPIGLQDYCFIRGKESLTEQEYRFSIESVTDVL